MDNSDPTHPLDSVLPFAVEALNVRGRVVRLHALSQELLRHHPYPANVNALLMQAVAMGVLLGSAIKLEGRLIVQTSTNGPISMLVVDYETPQDDQLGRVRAYARFDEAATQNAEPNDLLGTGHLALTVDMGTDESRYQGVVAVDEDGLQTAANHYFKQSEQLPTRIVLMVQQVGESIVAGGIFLQSLAPVGGDVKAQLQLANDNITDEDEDRNPFETDEWREAEARIMTLESDELLSEDLNLGHLLLRLFHGHGVRVYDTVPIEAFCRCSEDKVRDMLLQFPDEDRQDMEKDGKVGVVCEFCSRLYEFDADAIMAAQSL